jgi:hypothetical protein
MDSTISNSEIYLEFKDNFIWTTHDNEHLTLSQMNTIHIFNAMKMVYNNILSEHMSVNEVWYNRSWHLDEDNYLQYLLSMVVFCEEIERRGNLPEKYIEPYYCIMLELMSIEDISGRFTALLSNNKKQ